MANKHDSLSQKKTRKFGYTHIMMIVIAGSILLLLCNGASSLLRSSLSATPAHTVMTNTVSTVQGSCTDHFTNTHIGFSPSSYWHSIDLKDQECVNGAISATLAIQSDDEAKTWHVSEGVQGKTGSLTTPSCISAGKVLYRVTITLGPDGFEPKDHPSYRMVKC